MAATMAATLDDNHRVCVGENAQPNGFSIAFFLGVVLKGLSMDFITARHLKTSFVLQTSRYFFLC